MLFDHLDKLHQFRVICQTRSLRRAAESLGIAQPSLTRTVKILEAELKTVLFRRSPQGMELTQEGQVFLAFAESTLGRTEDVKQKIQFSQDETAGVLSIATFESLSVYLWPRLLSHLNRTLPNLRFRLKTNQRRDPMGQLAAGEFDLVVDAEPRPRENMVSTTLYRDAFQFYASSHLKEKDDTPFIYVQAAYDENDQTISEHLQAAGYMNPVPYEIDSFETAKALAAEGLGVAILPQRVAEDAVHSGLLKKLSLKRFSTAGFGRHRICVTYLASNRSDPRIKAAIKEMKALLAE